MDKKLPQDTLGNEISSQRQAAEDYLKTKRTTFDSSEELLHGQLNDRVSSKTKSQVFDPKLGSLTIERSYRVMAQLMTGKVRGISTNDTGDATLKNLLLEKYVIPNANAQFDFLTKMRMVDMYSNVYGIMPVLVDWDIKPNGYVGPDVWLLNIRDIFPQVGALSLEDSDYVIVRTWRSLSYFEKLKGNRDYKNIEKIITKLRDASGSKQNRDRGTSTSKREDDQYPQAEPAKNKGYYEVLTRYERKRWVDMCVDADNMVFRDRDNPHDDGEFPVVIKYSLPLIDDFMGMSDFERGGSMQKMINSMWNLYGDAVKTSIYPPVLINKDNIASMSSITYNAGAKWLVRNQIGNAAAPLVLQPKGIETFNNTYQVATASLLGIFGTSETNTTAQTDPGFGKTPQALSMQQARESTRDNADRFYMEQFLANVMKKFCNLLSKKQSSAITLRLFEDEIAVIAKSYPEVAKDYDKKTGKLSVKKGSGSELYDYEIVTGSTYAVDQKQQQQNLGNLLTMFQQAQTPQGNSLIEQLKQEGYEFHFGELLKRVVSNSGIQDWDKILTEMSPEEQAQITLDAHAMQFQQAMQQMQGNMNQTPTDPMQQGMPVDPSMQSAPPMPQQPMQGGGLQ